VYCFLNWGVDTVGLGFVLLCFLVGGCWSFFFGLCLCGSFVFWKNPLLEINLDSNNLNFMFVFFRFYPSVPLYGVLDNIY